MSGKLFVVGTPIGNLKDLTIRALDTLKQCDIVAAEDTRVSLKLLNAFDIKKSLISYHKHNENDRSNEIINLLKEGKNVALVSDAGMPGISDPGSVIIQKCIEEGIPFEVIPGVTAVITSLVYSGLNTEMFSFRGFFPRERKEREALFEEIKNYRDTLVFYESPHRMINALDFLKEKAPNRKIALCRELTKMHEEILRMTVEEAYNYYCEKQPKGEYVIVLEGKSDKEIQKEAKGLWENLSIEEHIKSFISEGLSKKEAIKKVAKSRDLPKSEVYKYSLNIE
ncbi:MAG: 16S rRNA (cytidine(1402)-2'-O)-methyltransferase [Clostridiaceae bacterium]